MAAARFRLSSCLGSSAWTWTRGRHACRALSSNVKVEKDDRGVGRPFDKVLVANRGEIACRVIRTCRRLGISSVAVFSSADTATPHREQADESWDIGPAPSAESYLRADKIVQVAKESGSQAIHPGYGFLSENANFASMIEAEGMKFIGPPVPAIRAMGDKVESKSIARAAGVNTIPGFDGVVPDADEAVRIARDVGYPVMIKASAGGGGKGMRVARNDSQVREGFRMSEQEAVSSFGDGRLLVEKFIDCPRHIEMQILADQHGNAVWLNERECSVQRRNQKVIEEAPSPFLDPKTRRAMGEQAVQLALAVGYVSAGTVEFLVDSQSQFYFLEMNTRLQVEHPVTECITGLDLVAEMLWIAAGHQLPMKQENVPLRGWAVESRVYAEDPYKAFGMPSVGRLSRYREPVQVPGVRIDSGVREGSEVSIYYDPMISKLVTWGEGRGEALTSMLQALDSYVIRGVTHNVSLLREVIASKRFASGQLSTAFLAEEYPDGFKGHLLTDDESEELVAVAAALEVSYVRRARTIKSQGRSLQMSFEPIELWVHLGDRKYEVKVTVKDEKTHVVAIEDHEVEVIGQIDLSSPLLSLEVAHNERLLQPLRHDATGHVTLQFLGTAYELRVLSPSVARLLPLMPEPSIADLSRQLLSPMPGTVISIAVAVGDHVVSGQEICVIEAMKMQNSLVSARGGKVKTVNIKPGSTVGEGDLLVEIE
uniref:propionyl-CoA carboxylase alpha chain, mitochondrial n=1 Tax=Myxine glutinosa TaxID=7769 RepID=UPI00358E30B4